MLSLAPRFESSCYGLNQRAWSRLDAGAAGYTNNGVPTNVLDRMELFYYDASWCLLERRTDESWNGTSFVHDSTSQWVWGQRYIDELVAGITDGDANDEFEDRFYAMTDRNFSVIGLSQSAGSSGERIRYDAYGHAQAMPLGDADHNGAVDLDDQNILLVNFGADIGDTGSPLYRVEADFNSDGAIDLDDLSTVLVNSGTSIDRGRLSASGNIVGYAGYIFEPATGMYVVRHRWYSTENGRWLSRDPLGYVDGQNMHAYASATPISSSDPMGLLKVEFDGNFTPEQRQRFLDAIDALKECANELVEQIDELQKMLDESSECVRCELGDEIRGYIRYVYKLNHLLSGDTPYQIRQGRLPIKDQAHSQYFNRRVRSLAIIALDVYIRTAGIGGIVEDYFERVYWVKFQNRGPQDFNSMSDLGLRQLMLHELIHVIEYEFGDPDRDKGEKNLNDVRSAYNMEHLCFGRAPKLITSRVQSKFFAARSKCGEQ